MSLPSEIKEGEVTPTMLECLISLLRHPEFTMYELVRCFLKGKSTIFTHKGQCTRHGEYYSACENRCIIIHVLRVEGDFQSRNDMNE